MLRRSYSSLSVFSRSLPLFCSGSSSDNNSTNDNNNKRFSSPWADSGMDPSNLHTSSNPLQRKKRDENRLRDFIEESEANIAHDEHITRDREIRSDSERQMRERLTNFKPLGGGGPAATRTAAKHHADDIASISSGIFTHLEQYRASARLQNPHVDIDLDNFLPLPQTIEEIKQKSDNFTKFPYGGRLGFALDMDGVLIRGSPNVGVKVIEGVKEAISFLKQAKIPFIVMTNGGGNLEEVLARNLTRRFHLDEEYAITEDQVMVSTTPMKALLDDHANSSKATTSLRKKPVLVLGPYETGCKVLRSYGFENPIHVRDFQAQFPQFAPLQTFPESMQETVNNSLKNSAGKSDDEIRSEIPQFAAAFIISVKGIDAFHDYQILQDVVLGVPAGKAGGSEVAESQQIPIYYASEDLFWPSAPKIPRLGFGAMKEMFSGIFESVTGEAMNFTTYGKPRRIAYLQAQKMLKEQNKKLGWADNKAPDLICMVGDNIDTDITGANAMNSIGSSSLSSSKRSKWMSVHVMTGVGRVPPACRSIPSTDSELEWLSTHFVDCSPHYVAPTFRHFVGEICHFDETQITQMVTESHVLPNPVDVKELYNWNIDDDGS